MISLKSFAVAAAIIGGATALSGPASAAPVPAGAGVAGVTDAAPLVQTVQYGYRRGYYRRGFYGPRPGWRRGFYGRPVVCRWRPTPFGPRRVCFRRW